MLRRWACGPSEAQAVGAYEILMHDESLTNQASLLTTVEDWVEYIQTLHAREIELSLERTRIVYQRLVPEGVRSTVVSIAGTNGKGSTAQLLNRIYLCAGYRVGKYTSPHLLRFNERIQINGEDASDEQLLNAFQAVENARRDTPLTFFEFGTLLAIYLFDQAEVDLMVMEVGLGGRLDAVNILDCNLAIITSISKDHTAWLGETIAEISGEKAGIVRAGKPAVIGETRDDQALLEACKTRGALITQLGRDFDHQISDTAETPQSWCWYQLPRADESTLRELALPYNQTGVQLNNAACAIQAVRLLNDRLLVSNESIASGLEAASMNGRCQIVGQTPLTILDVAHNEDSVRVLAEQLQRLKPVGRVLAVCGMLKDKEIEVSLSQIAAVVDAWFLGSIAGERGSSSSEINSILSSVLAKVGVTRQAEREPISISLSDDMNSAFSAATDVAQADDCIVVFGSFFVVADILAHLEQPFSSSG